VYKKRPPLYFLNNYVKNQPILIIVYDILKKLGHPRVTNLPTSPAYCCRTTLRSAKSDFQQDSTVISIKQLI